MPTLIVYLPIHQKVSRIEILRSTKSRFSVLRMDWVIAVRRSAYQSLGGASAPKTVTGTVTFCQYTGQVTSWVYATLARLIMQLSRWRITTLEWCICIMLGLMMHKHHSKVVILNLLSCMINLVCVA